MSTILPLRQSTQERTRPRPSAIDPTFHQIPCAPDNQSATQAVVRGVGDLRFGTKSVPGSGRFLLSRWRLAPSAVWSRICAASGLSHLPAYAASLDRVPSLRLARPPVTL